MADAGEIILRAAQGIVAQQQQQQQMQLRLVQFEEQVKQTEKNFDLRQRELDLRDRAIKVQEEQAVRAEGLQGFRVKQAELEIEKTQGEIELLDARATAALRPQPGGGRGLTPNQQLRLTEEVEQRARSVEMSRMASGLEEKFGADVPRHSTAQGYLAERRRLQQAISAFQTSKSAQEAKILNEKLGDGQELEIDKMEDRLNLLNRVIASDEFKTLRDTHDLEGPSPDTRQAVIQKFFPGFEGAISVGADAVPRTPVFQFSRTPEDRQRAALDNLLKGNGDMFFDNVMDELQGGLTPDADRKLRAYLNDVSNDLNDEQKDNLRAEYKAFRSRQATGQ